ncbi:MAG: hypothetical protein AB7O68_25880 [Pirellulales bacterium]
MSTNSFRCGLMVLNGTIMFLVAQHHCVVASQLPWGSTYTLSGTNVPGNLSPTKLTFDGVAEQAGGLLVNESFLPYAGKSPYTLAVYIGPPVVRPEFAQAGLILELSLKTADGNSFYQNAINPFAGWSLKLSDLNVGGQQVSIRHSAVYLIPFQDGQPVPLSPLSAYLISLSGVAPDPLDRAEIPNVLVPTPSVDLGGDFTGTIATELTEKVTYENFLTWNHLNLALANGLPAPVALDELRIGIIVEAVPEPSAWCLATSAVAWLLCAWHIKRRQSVTQRRDFWPGW